MSIAASMQLPSVRPRAGSASGWTGIRADHALPAVLILLAFSIFPLIISAYLSLSASRWRRAASS